MCGLAGAVGGLDDDRLAVVHTMMKLMGHRGPDSAGVSSAGDAALGMCQLRIRETASRSVPLRMRGEHRRLAAYNGEIYTGVWSSSLLQRQSGIPSNVDEEVAAIVSQLDGFEPPDGMFAFATSSDGAPTTCFRDAFGIKPLYFRHGQDGLLFASELRALTSVRDKPRLRQAAIAEFLLYGRCLQHETFYDGISSFTPGVRAVLEESGPRVDAQQPTYWRAQSAGPAELRAAIREALELTMISERTVGIALSGGLDSTIIAAELSMMGVEGLHTFSVKVDGQDDGCDSLASLSLPGGAWKTWTHHIVPFGPTQLAEGMRRSTTLAAEPTRMTSFPLYLALAAAVKEAGIVVLLCGEGADELFGGYGSYRRWVGRAQHLSIGELAEYACPSEKMRSVEALLQESSVREARSRFDLQFSDCARHSPFDGLRRLEQYLRLEPLLHRTDLALMAYSIEGRVPYLHGRVPELAYGLSLHECLSDEQTKIALRRAYSTVILPHRAAAAKTNFRAPITSWFAGPLAPFVRSEMALLQPHLEEHGLSALAMRETVEASLLSDRHAGAMTFNLLSLGAFLRDHEQEGMQT